MGIGRCLEPKDNRRKKDSSPNNLCFAPASRNFLSGRNRGMKESENPALRFGNGNIPRKSRFPEEIDGQGCPSHTGSPVFAACQ